MKNIFFTLIFFFPFVTVVSQIQTNEKLVYAASYNMSGLMTQLAQVTLETKPVQTSKKTFLHLGLVAETFSKWDYFFKIRDLYESYVDPGTLKPSLYKRNIFEGGYTKAEKYIFSSDGKSVSGTTRKRNQAEQKISFKKSTTSQDIVSLIYKLRTVDFRSFKKGQVISYVVVFDQKEFPVIVKYMGKENVFCGSLGLRECYKVSIAAKTNVLRGADKNLIWITTDSKKIPVLIKFSIPVGTGQLKLASAT